MRFETSFKIIGKPQSVALEFGENGELLAFRPAFLELPEAAQLLAEGSRADLVAEKLTQLGDVTRIAAGLLRNPEIARSEAWPHGAAWLRQLFLEHFSAQPKPYAGSDFWLETLEEAGFFEPNSPTAASFPLEKVCQALYIHANEALFEYFWNHHPDDRLVWTALLPLVWCDAHDEFPPQIAARADRRAMSFLIEMARRPHEWHRDMAQFALANAQPTAASEAFFLELWQKEAANKSRLLVSPLAIHGTERLDAVLFEAFETASTSFQKAIIEAMGLPRFRPFLEKKAAERPDLALEIAKSLEQIATMEA